MILLQICKKQPFHWPRFLHDEPHLIPWNIIAQSIQGCLVHHLRLINDTFDIIPPPLFLFPPTTAIISNVSQKNSQPQTPVPEIPAKQKRPCLGLVSSKQQPALLTSSFYQFFISRSWTAFSIRLRGIPPRKYSSSSSVWSSHGFILQHP